MIRKHYRLTGLALALVIAALMAPAASARPIDWPSPQTLPAHSSTPTSNPGSSAPVLRRDGSKAVPFVADVGTEAPPAADGFDWGDAGIGAGAGFALAMIGLGGVLLLGNRRQGAEQPLPTA